MRIHRRRRAVIPGVTLGQLAILYALLAAGCGLQPEPAAQRVAGPAALTFSASPIVGAQSQRCVDISGRSTANGSQAQLWDCNGGTNQSFAYDSAASKYLVVYGNKCLQASGGGTSTGTAVVIGDCTGQPTQQWNVNADGTIGNVQSGLCMDASGAATANGTKIILWTCGSGANQRWTVSGATATYALTVAKSGAGAGTVTSTPSAIDCGSACSANYAAGTSVTLSAAAASGSTFGGWSGACSGTQATCTIAMTAARTVTATFQAALLDATISVNAGGAAAGSFVADTSFTGGSTYTTTNAVDTAQLGGTAPPPAVFQTERYGEFTYTFPNRTPGSAQTVTLYFAETYWTAAGQRTFNVAINGATALAAFDILAAAGGARKAVARTFDTTASATGQVAIQFTRAGGVDNPKVCGITVAARGAGDPTYTLTVTKAGTGNGLVSGGGINCGNACSASLASGTIVTLSATADSGSRFTGWSGACAGTSATCPVDLTAARSVIATFDATQPPPPDAQIRGINWADQRDNFVNGVLYVSGLGASDNYSSAAIVASRVVGQLYAISGANTVRLPINEPTVSNYWSTYTGAIDSALGQGRVILAYWAYTGGKPQSTSAFYAMWDQVVARYGSNANAYFEVINEPSGYGATDLTNLYNDWLNRYPSVPRGRVILDGTGLAQDATPIGRDSRLNGTLIAVHDYSFFAGFESENEWANHIGGSIGAYASRTVVTEWGGPMGPGSKNGVSYDTIDYSIPSGSFFADYIRGVSSKLRSLGVGSVYWPGLRDGDWYSLTRKSGTGSGITLSLVNSSGLTRLQYAWGMGTGGGTYVRVRNAATNLYLDGLGSTASGSIAGQSSATGNDSQWIVENSDSYVRIRNRATGLYLDGAGRTANGSDVAQWSSSTGTAQQWSVVTDGNRVLIRNRATGLYLDGMGRTTSGSAAGQYASGTSLNQRWTIVAAE